MYTFRKITDSNTQINISIGDSYSYVNREENYESFCKDFENYFQRNHVADLFETSDKDTKNVYAFISFQGKIMPLYKNDHNYIMTENGKTFSNLTYK